MDKVRDICRSLEGVEVGDEDLLACFYIDKTADIRAVVLRDALLIETPSMTTRIDLDDVLSVEHDPLSKKLVVRARDGKIEINPQ